MPADFGQEAMKHSEQIGSFSCRSRSRAGKFRSVINREAPETDEGRGKFFYTYADIGAVFDVIMLPCNPGDRLTQGVECDAEQEALH